MSIYDRVWMNSFTFAVFAHSRNVHKFRMIYLLLIR